MAASLVTENDLCLNSDWAWAPYFCTRSSQCAVNAADSAVQRIRQDNNLNVVIYTIGYTGGSEVPDETWMKRISNDPDSASYVSAEPPGLYVNATTTGGLSAAFARVASEILRLAL